MQNGTTNVPPPPAAAPTAAPTAPAQANWLAKLKANPWLLRKMLMLAIIVGVGVAAFCWGRWQPATAKGTNEPAVEAGNYSKRAVAYLYGDSVTVTREELGEYLIARFATNERLEFMLNRKIVQMECEKYGITATDREVEERFQYDLYLGDKKGGDLVVISEGQSLHVAPDAATTL